MRVRLFNNPFNSDHVDRIVNGRYTVAGLLSSLGCDGANCIVYDGQALVTDRSRQLEQDCVTVRIIPQGMDPISWAILIGGLLLIAIPTAIAVFQDLTRQPSMDKVQTSPSLRGSSNTARQGQRLPIVLGRHRVYPDLAAQPYSSYIDDNQYLHQLFCFGYKDVVVDESTIKIGETPLSKYSGAIYELNPSPGTVYPQRVLETYVGIRLEHGGTAVPVERTTASGTYRVDVGIIAPNGCYRYDDKGKKHAVDIGIRIEWRIPGGTWRTAHDVTRSLNKDKWREMFVVDVSGAVDGLYETRVQRTTAEGDTSKYNDYVYYDVLTCHTQDSAGNRYPVKDPGRYSMASLKLQATNQLNGIVDSLNAVCTLSTRAYTGNGTGPAAWAVQPTRNPAAALLYLLTDPCVNPRPVSDDVIVWEELEDFALWCDKRGFSCDAYVTGDFTIRQLCDYICQSNLAQLNARADRIGIRIDRAQPYVSQMFTPRNAFNFSLTRDFSDLPDTLKLKFVSADVGYVEVERTVQKDEGGKIVYDVELTDDDDAQEVTLFGVTSPAHAARVGATRLKALYAQRRTYSWETDIEGLLCLPGDVVLLSNDNFLIGLGQGRIRKIIEDESRKALGIYLDEDVTMVSGGSYGVRIRHADGITDSIPIRTEAGSTNRLMFADIHDELLTTGDLCIFGEYRVEATPLLVTEISTDEHYGCKIKGVDYVESVYDDSDIIPEYDPGISVYPEGTVVGAGRLDPSETPVIPGVPGTAGNPGTDGKTINVSLSRSQIPFYADNVAKISSPVVVTVVYQGLADVPSLYVDGQLVPMQNDTYRIPVSVLDAKDSIEITATSGEYTQTVTLSKVMEAGTLSLTLDNDMFRYYADGEAHPGQAILAMVTSSGYSTSPKLYVDGNEVPLSTSGTYSISPDVVTSDDSVMVTASIAGQRRTRTISRRNDEGTLTLSVSNDNVRFYADDVPYDQLPVKVTVESSGFSTAPVLTQDGVPVILTAGGYEMRADDLIGADSVSLQATVHNLKRTAVIHKVMDAGVVTLDLSRDTFRYYADGPQYAGQAPIMATMSYAGFSKPPVMTVAGIAVTPSGGSYPIPQTVMGDARTVEVKASIAGYAQSRTIRRAVDEGIILLSLNAYMFHYYANDVPYSQGDITATVEWSGLYNTPKLTVGGVDYDLVGGRATISPGAVSAADTVEVKAYSAEIPGLTRTAIISKQKDMPTLTLQSDATQFSYDEIGTLKGPQRIVLSYRTTGLSGVVPGLTVAGVPQAWDDSGRYAVDASLMDGRGFIECIATVGAYSLSSSVLLVRTQDGASSKMLRLSTDVQSFRLQADGEPYPDQIATLNVLKQNIPEQVHWEIPSHVIPDGTMRYQITPADMGYGTGSARPASLPVTVTAGAYSDSVTIGVVSDGVNAGGEYLGFGTTPPATRMDGSDVQYGDYYLDTSDIQNPVPYIMEDNGQWKPVGRDDPRWSYIAPNTQNDVLNLGGTLLTTSAYYAYFANISGNNASIDSIGTKKLVLKENGEIVSENYYPTGGSEGMRISANGNVDFNNGTWRGDIASGLMRVQRGSELPDGTNAFDYNQSIIVNEVYQRYIRMGVITSTYDNNFDFSGGSTLPVLNKLDAKSYNFMGLFDANKDLPSTIPSTCKIFRTYNIGKGMFLVMMNNSNDSNYYYLLVTQKAMKARLNAGLSQWEDFMSIKGVPVDASSQFNHQMVMLAVYDDIKQKCFCMVSNGSGYDLMATDVNGTSVNFTKVAAWPASVTGIFTMKPMIAKVYEKDQNRYRYVGTTLDTSTITSAVVYSYDMLNWTSVPIPGNNLAYYDITYKNEYYYMLGLQQGSIPPGEAPAIVFARMKEDGTGWEALRTYTMDKDMMGGDDRIAEWIQNMSVYASRVSNYVYCVLFSGISEGQGTVGMDGRCVRYDTVKNTLSTYEPPTPMISLTYSGMMEGHSTVRSFVMDIGYDAVHDKDIFTLGMGLLMEEQVSYMFMFCMPSVVLVGKDDDVVAEFMPFGGTYGFSSNNPMYFTCSNMFQGDTEGSWLPLVGTDANAVFFGWEVAATSKTQELNQQVCFPVTYPMGQYIRKVSDDEFRVSIYGMYGYPFYFNNNIGSFTVKNGDMSPCPAVSKGLAVSAQISFISKEDISPFIVNSTHVVTNLNADLLDGKHAQEIINQSAGSVYADQARNSASQAQVFANNASGSATAASNSATAANNSAKASDGSATTALAHANDAKTYADDALSAKNGAMTYAGNAESSSVSSANSAAAAAESAGSASNSAIKAANSSAQAEATIAQADGGVKPYAIGDNADVYPLMVTGNNASKPSAFTPARTNGNLKYNPWMSRLMVSTLALGGNERYTPLPNGGEHYTNTNAITGAIRITLPPNLSSSCMITFWVDVFDYSNDESFSVYIAGYTYMPSATTPQWVNTSAKMIGDRNYVVRFGVNNTDFVIQIGETTSTWNYLQVVVRDMHVGYGNATNSWRGQFTISTGVTTLPTTTNRVLVAPNPMARQAGSQNNPIHVLLSEDNGYGVCVPYTDNDLMYNPTTNTLEVNRIFTSSMKINGNLDVVGMVNAQGQAVSSRRSLKKDIQRYRESALDVVESVDVVSFHMKDDETRRDRVGFIADDTAEILAGKEHDSMYIDNCVGILLKAVQELNVIVKEQRREIDRLKDIVDMREV